MKTCQTECTCRQQNSEWNIEIWFRKGKKHDHGEKGENAGC